MGKLERHKWKDEIRLLSFTLHKKLKMIKEPKILKLLQKKEKKKNRRKTVQDISRYKGLSQRLIFMKGQKKLTNDIA